MSVSKFALSLVAFALVVSTRAEAVAPPVQPNEPQHPGSSAVFFNYGMKSVSCLGRTTDVYVPVGTGQTFPAVSFGHGQALARGDYEAMFKHLAEKGVATIFVPYDTGFFDQDWQRMGDDFQKIVSCALDAFPTLDASKVVYSGHSKGAYIASIAAGKANVAGAVGSPKAIVLFETAGFDPSTAKLINAQAALTIITSDDDKTVDQEFSENLFKTATSQQKQLIRIRSYLTTSPTLTADHFWPLTKSTFLGGREPNALHYFGSWKWLTAAAQDLSFPTLFTNPYVYGDLAIDKGLPGESDQVQRTIKH